MTTGMIPLEQNGDHLLNFGRRHAIDLFEHHSTRFPAPGPRRRGIETQNGDGRTGLFEPSASRSNPA